MILDEIIAKKRISVDRLKGRRSVSALQDAAAAATAPRDFLRAVQSDPRPAVIAEIKRASPSAGVIRDDPDIGAIVSSYEKGGAAAISVITEENFFAGRPEYLRQASALSRLPVLCKDFIIDPVQIYAARSVGADALLLIAAALDRSSLVNLLTKARSMGMACLVEVHDEEELTGVLSTDARLIGINNRNLKTLEVTLETTKRLRPLIPGDRLVVSESGVQGRGDILALEAVGVDAVLVGTSLMRCSDPEKKLRELKGLS